MRILITKTNPIKALKTKLRIREQNCQRPHVELPDGKWISGDNRVLEERVQLSITKSSKLKVQIWKEEIEKETLQFWLLLFIGI